MRPPRPPRLPHRGEKPRVVVTRAAPVPKRPCGCKDVKAIAQASAEIARGG
jgi:hypothetical protein